MIDIIDRLEAGLREQLRQDEVDLQEAEMNRRRAYLRREQTQVLLTFVELLRATAGSADDETATPASLTGGKLGGAAVDEPAYEPGAIIREMRGPDFWRRNPAVDRMGDPIYDVSVVSGLPNSRERALAAARVYGYRLRELSLAEAIFRTGETNASSPQSIRGSLGGLVKYGGDWKRERGWLVYCGDELEADWDTLERLGRETTSLREEARQAEDTAQAESDEG